MFDVIVERNARRGRAVVLVGDHDDRQVGVGAQEALVLGRRRLTVGAESARDGRELVLEPAAALAQRRHAGEHVLQVAGVVPDAVDVGDERRVVGEPGRRAVAARRVLEDAVLAARRVAAADRPVAGAHVRRRDRDVDVGQAAGKILERGHEGREVPAQVVLRQFHRRRVVDQEQQVDVAVDDQRDHALAGHAGHEVGPFDRARVAREQRGRERGEREPAERATQPATGTKRTKTTNERRSCGPPAEVTQQPSRQATGRENRGDRARFR